jgi:hypothetical protein
LRALARFAQSDFFSLDFTRVAREEAGAAQRLSQRFIVPH